MTTIDEAQRALEQAQWNLARARARAARFGSEPAVGSVLTFRKHYGNRSYDYAALRTDAGWFLTGRETEPKTWEELRAFIGENNTFQVATEWTVRRDVAALPGQWQALSGGKGKWAGPFLGVALDAASQFASWTARPSPEQAAPSKVFRVRPVLELGDGEPVDAAYEVLDPAGEVVATFPADQDGQRRAQQSARDRTRHAATPRAATAQDVEPVMYARIRSVEQPTLWAQRLDYGWIISRGSKVQIVRTHWDRVRNLLGTWEPGSYVSDGLTLNEGPRSNPGMRQTRADGMTADNAYYDETR